MPRLSFVLLLTVAVADPLFAQLEVSDGRLESAASSESGSPSEPASSPQPNESLAKTTPSPATSEAVLRADLMFLASDQLRGRSAADDSIDVAAEYLIGRMDEIGLDTAVFSGSAKQALTVPLPAQPGDPQDNRIEFAIDGEQERLAASLGEGMNPLVIGANRGHVTGRVVFAGYGITAPKLGYDDYEGIDASGAVVIVLRKEPGMNDPDSRFDGTRNTRHAFFATKVTNAIKHGAGAIIIVNDPTSVLSDVQNARSKISQEQQRKEAAEKQLESLPEEAINSRESIRKRIRAIDRMIESFEEQVREARRGVLAVADAGTSTVGKPAIPVASVARDVIDTLLSRTIGQSLEDLESQIDRTGSPQSHSLANASVDLRVSLRPATATTSNVAGVLPGKGDLANETVVVGAHYDHVGMGGFGSLAPGTIAVHNGADDNASGTTALLGVATNLVTQLAEVPSHRRVLFIAFTAEERGLLGSKYYVRNPRFPIDSTVAMVNMDMVGRLHDNELTVYGTGSAESFDDMVEQSNQRHQFKLFKVATGYGPSDHQSFYEVGIPVLFFFTGLHNDYHRPTDDFDKIDFGGMVRITDTVSDVTFQLAVRRERPKYAETEKKVRIRRQMTAFLGVTLSDRGDHVVLSGINPGGPAERGGLRVGDRLERLGERRVRNAADVLEAIRERSPGDSLAIRVTRDGKSIDLTARLQARP